MPHALIAGAGIAGLTAAIALRRAGWSVEVHERAGALHAAGTAINLWPNAIAALNWLGVGQAVCVAGAPIRTTLVADMKGRAIIGPREAGPSPRRLSTGPRCAD